MGDLNEAEKHKMMKLMGVKDVQLLFLYSLEWNMWESRSLEE